MEVEPFTFEDYIKTQEQSEAFLDNMKYAFSNQMRKLFQSTDLLMKFTHLTVNNIYKQQCDSPSLSQVIQFYEHFMLPELSDQLMNLVIYLINEALMSLTGDIVFVSIVAKVEHVIQLFNIAYLNKGVPKLQLELASLFARGFSVIIKLHKLQAQMLNLSLT
jgi:hypothetical protein